MKNKIQLMIAALLISILLVSCAGTQDAAPAVEDNKSAVEEAAPAAMDEPEAAAGKAELGESALLVGEMPFSMDQLEAMNTRDVEYTGKDDSVTVYTGVPILDLLGEAGLQGETVVLTASDGYEAEVSAAELESCADCVVAFDDGELRSVFPGFSGKAQVKGLVEISVK